MEQCLFCNKECNKRPIFEPNKVAYFLNQKLVQYVFCIFSVFPFNRWLDWNRTVSFTGETCLGRMLECANFVAICIERIYNIRISPEDLEMGFLERLNITQFNLINSPNRLSILKEGDILFTLPQYYIKDPFLRNIPYAVSSAYLRTTTGLLDLPTMHTFSHVFFYLGKSQQYIGGTHHSSTMYPNGIVPFNRMFTFNMDGTIQYIHPVNPGMKLFLFSATIR